MKDIISKVAMISRKENKARNIALFIIGFMILIWTVLGVLSFTDREGYERPMSSAITFAGETALQGKKVFQSYNCMDCHTIVGNGAYFAPDLTKIYTDTGPAYLAAYLSSPGTYPTEAVVNIQLQQQLQEGDVETTDLGDYYSKFPRAQERVEERGGIEALMPNLQFTKPEINALIAFFKYTGKINTAGWPPAIRAKESVITEMKRKLEQKSGLTMEALPQSKVEDSGALGSKGEHSGLTIAEEMGCIACHSTDGSSKIGPTWKNLFGQTVSLTTGETITADRDYLEQSIWKPDKEIVEGYPGGVMPSYEGVLTEEEVASIVAYIESLK